MLLYLFPEGRGLERACEEFGGVTHKADGFVGEADVETNDLASCNVKWFPEYE